MPVRRCRPGSGLRRGPGLPAAPVGPGQPAALLGRDRPAHRGGAPRRRPGDRRARRLGAAPGGHLQPGHAPAARDRTGHARAAGAAGARRADERARPAADPRHARGAAAYAAAGRTVLVSSHLLAEVEQTCSHVVVMHQGTVVAGGTVDDIIAGGGLRASRSTCRRGPPRSSAVSTACARWPSTATPCTPSSTAPRSSAVRALVDAGVEVRSAGPRRRLEDAFLQLVGEDQAR